MLLLFSHPNAAVCLWKGGGGEEANFGVEVKGTRGLTAEKEDEWRRRETKNTRGNSAKKEERNTFSGCCKSVSPFPRVIFFFRSADISHAGIHNRNEEAGFG